MSLQRYEPAGTLAIPTEREEAYIGRLCERYAASDMCPARWKGKASELQVVYDSLAPLGVPFTLRVLKQCYVIDNQLEIMAQLQVAIAARDGIDVVPDDKQWDDRHAVVHITPPGKPMRTTTYTIDDARNNHLLDEWVEKWETAASGKKYSKKFVVAVDGTPTDKPLPDWAKKELAEGRVKRKDPWFSSRRDMLMARAVTRGLRYSGAHALLGLGGPDLDDLPAGPVPARSRPVLVEDEVGDSEVIHEYPTQRADVDGPDRGGSPGSVETSPATGPSETSDQAGATSPEGGRTGSESAPIPEAEGAADDAEADSAAPDATLFGEPDDDDDPLVDAGYVQRFAIACRELAEQRDRVDADELRHAIVYAATNGTRTSSKQLRQSQIRAVNGWFSDYRLGKAVLRSRIGEDGLTLVPLPPEEEPF